MEVKGINLKLINDSNLKAICSINFENLFVVHGVRLVSGKEGMFLSFPARIKGNNNFIDVAHPIDSEFRNQLTELVIEHYNDEKDK